MSKEQTPIEELVIKLADLYTDLGNSKRPDQGMKLVSTITKEIEQFTQAKVLEALEREVIKARVSKDIAIKEKVLKHIVSEEVLDKYISDAQKYYETKVKPKYEK